tara:strand:+ start:412 stop:741 length:330 start_codon:yes stop_codon:yes gene_type:complete
MKAITVGEVDVEIFRGAVYITHGHGCERFAPQAARELANALRYCAALVEAEEFPPDGNHCRACGKPSLFTIYCSPECAPACPHGEEMATCNACSVAADLAFDAAREDRS